MFQVLGDYNRLNKTTDQIQKFIKEIESISSEPLHDHFFNVTDEWALTNIVDALGSKIFALEGIPLNKHTSPDESFKESFDVLRETLFSSQMTLTPICSYSVVFRKCSVSQCYKICLTIAIRAHNLS